MTRCRAAATLLCALLASALRAQGTHSPSAPDSSTLDKVRTAHELACAVVQEDAEYSTEDDHSSRGAFDSALCQAFAVAVDARAAVKVTSFLDEPSALIALRSGSLDVIASVSAGPLHLEKGVRLSRIVFYDSLGLLVPVASGLQHAADLAGRKICVLAETGAEEALRTWFAQRRIDYLPFPFQEEGEMEAAYVTHNCAALAAERTRLSMIRLSLSESASQHVILPEALSRDPMAPATEARDAQWSRIIDVVTGTLLLAEQIAVTSGNVDGEAAKQAGSAAARLRGARDRGVALGLRPTWAADVLRSAGNYAQMYERTLGKGSDRQLPRDLNRLQRDGGLLTATPLDQRP